MDREEPSLEAALEQASIASSPTCAAPPGSPPRHRGASLQSKDEDQDLERRIADIRDYQITNGSLLKLVQYASLTQTPAAPVNVSLEPTPFPRKLYEDAVALQQSMNELYVRVANDEDWLYSVLRPQIENDRHGLVAKLWDVHVKCKEAGPVQDVVCGIFRSDYMLCGEDENAAGEESEKRKRHGNGGRLGGKTVSLKQVEMNNFSVAGACHAERVAGMHRHMLQKRLSEQTNHGFQPQQIPSNTNIASLVSGLRLAHQTYARAHHPRDSPDNKPICILMVVQPFNFNIADERPIEHELWNEQVPCYRCEWRSIRQQCCLDTKRTLFFRPEGSRTEFEVSLVYYRAGYDPREYADESGCKTRVMLEMSRAIRCPDVLTHLSTFKSVQQALAQPGVAERFLASHATTSQKAAVRDTFMPIYPIDTSPAGIEARKIATDPVRAEEYVLKPNLEGGGHNVYRSHIPTFLADVGEERWHEYILMKLITPPQGQNGILLAGEEGVYEGDVVSELGIIGFVMWKRVPGDGMGERTFGEHADNSRGVGDVEIVKNDVAGWTFKTKPRSVDEMSVVKGYGCFDCPVLT